MNNTLKLVAMLIAIVCCGNATATDYYVSVTGDNTDTGLTIGSAWQNVAYATQQVVAGDTIYLLDGTWNDEHCTFANSGTAANPITLTAYSGTPTLDGIDKTGCGIDIDEMDHIKISHLTMRRYYRTIDEPGSYIHISNCDLSDTGEAVMVISRPYSTHNTIEDCTLYDSGWNTVQLLANRAPPNGNGIPTTHITVRNCTIYNSNVHNAIDLYGNMEYITIEDNTIHNCSCAGVFVHDRPDFIGYTLVKNNTFTDMGYISPIDLGEAYEWEICDNTFTNSLANYPIYIYLNSRDLWIHDNEFYNTESPRVVDVYDDIVFDRNYLHTDCNPYMSSYNATITVRNPLGKQSVDVRFNSSTAHLEWDDGTVFTATPFDDYTSWTPVRYYPDRSSCSIISGDDAALIGDVTTYAVTLAPTNDYLMDVTVSHESTPADDRTNITIDSSISTNPTLITAKMQNATATYNISIDGVITDQVTSDEDKIASYSYTGTWTTPHTFMIVWSAGGAAPPPPPPTDTNVMWISDIDLPIGDLVSVPISIENATGIAGVSMTISYTPSVIEIVGGSVGDFTWNYSLNCDDVAGGTATLFTLIDAQTLSGDLTVGYIDVQAVGDSGESSNLAISDVVLCDDYGTYIIPDDVIAGSVTLTGTIPGDADGNGVVNILDVLTVMQYLMYPATTPIDLDAADVCGAPGVDIADATLILSHCIDPVQYPLGG